MKRFADRSEALPGRLHAGGWPTTTQNERHDGQDDEDDKQDLCNPRGIACNAAETEDGGDDGDDQEDDGVTEHVVDLGWMVSIKHNPCQVGTTYVYPTGSVLVGEMLSLDMLIFHLTEQCSPLLQPTTDTRASRNWV